MVKPEQPTKVSALEGYAHPETGVHSFASSSYSPEAPGHSHVDPGTERGPRMLSGSPRPTFLLIQATRFPAESAGPVPAAGQTQGRTSGF